MIKNLKYVNIYLSWHLIPLLAILESITVPLVVIMPSVYGGFKSPLHGFVIGFFGTYIISYLLNYVIFWIKIHIGNNTLRHVGPPFGLAFWGGTLLSILFMIQNLLPKNDLSVTSKMMIGFLSAGGSSFITLSIYPYLIRVIPNLSINFSLNSHSNCPLKNSSKLSISILIAIYEAIAFPIINLWTLMPNPQSLYSILTGVAGGAVGSAIIIIIYRIPILKNKFWLLFEYKDEQR